MVDPAIAVNLLWCVPGDVGGSEEYLVRQLLGLAEAEPRLRPTLYVVEGFVDAHRALTEQFPTVVATFDGASRPRRIVGEATWFRRQTSSADLRHHGGGAAPIAAVRPYLLTVHDLQYRTYPEYFSRTKRAYLAAMIGRSVRKARTVIGAERVRAHIRDRCLRRRSVACCGGAARVRARSARPTSPTSRSCARGSRSATAR